MRPFHRTLAVASLLAVSCSYAVDMHGRLKLPPEVQAAFSPTQRGAVVLELQFLDEERPSLQMRVGTLCDAQDGERVLPLEWSEDMCVRYESELASVRAFVAPVPEGDTLGCNDVSRQWLNDEELEALRSRAVAVGSQDVAVEREALLRLFPCEGGAFSWDFVLSPIVAP